MSNGLMAGLVPVLLACGQAPSEEAGSASAPIEAETSGGEVAAPSEDAPATPRPPLVASVPIPELVEIGLGSGRDGLETIRIDGDGVAVIHRAAVGVSDIQRGTLMLTDAQRIAIAERIDRDQIYAMDGTYSAGRMDGTQLVLRIVQDGDETVIYCDNECPDEVGALYQELLQIVEEAPPGDVRWEWADDRSHDRALWEAVQGPRRGRQGPVRQGRPRR